MATGGSGEGSSGMKSREESEGERGEGVRRRGKCKWFNVVKGYGFITPDDGGPEVFLHQTVIQMPGFRSLGEGEAVEFECTPSDKGFEATLVCGVEGAQCRGSDRRPVSKKKHKKLRCYNCGEFASHVAARCPQGPLPKRCHICKSSDHLVADCPQRPPESTPGDGSTSSESAPSAGVSSPSISSPPGSSKASQPAQRGVKDAAASTKAGGVEERAEKGSLESSTSRDTKKDSSGGAASPPTSQSSASPKKPSEPKS